MNNNPLPGLTIKSFSNPTTSTSSSAAASTSNPSAPLKLTFRLGGTSTVGPTTASTSYSSQQSSVTPSAPESEMDIDSNSEAGSSVLGAPSSSHGGGRGVGVGERERGSVDKGDRGLDDGRAPLDFNRGNTAAKVGKPKGRPKASTSAAIPLATGEIGEEKPKQKRKRAPNRPRGEPGPGKSWRKGLKGNLAGTGVSPRITTPTPYSYKPQPSPSASTSGQTSTTTPSAPRAFPVGPTPKIAANYIPPQPLEVKTPRPRRWTKAVKELTSVTGTILKFKSWQGSSSSAYYDATHISLPAPISVQQAPNLYPASPALSDYSPLPLPQVINPAVLSQIPLSLSQNPIAPLQFSLKPSSSPLYSPLVPSIGTSSGGMVNRDPTVAALAAANAFRVLSSASGDVEDI